ncbi:MAG: 3-hydroxyacyl-ACP dehydratase FabZ [Myxococcota bacterium]|nr:3-hydroxyacyl-ACP dehydratase FabZ [Myxococcota bacterium]
MSSTGLDTTSILGILPHKQPAVLLDRVIEIEPAERILAIKNATISDPAFLGHYPRLPVMPGTVLIEAMVQASSILAYATERYDPAETLVQLVGLSKTKFHRFVFPGDVVELESRLLRRSSNVWRFEARAFCRDIPVMESTLALALVGRRDALRS